MRRALPFLGFLALLGLSLAIPYRWGQVRPALAFAAAYPSLPVMLSAIFGMLYGLIGAGFGLPGLFWNDRLRTRAGASMAVTLLLALLGTVTFHVAERHAASAGDLREGIVEALARVGLDGPRPEEGDFSGWIARFLVAASPPFLTLLVAPALLPGAFPRVPRSIPDPLIARDRLGPRRGRTLSVRSNTWGWALGLAAWLAGVAIGVVILAGLFAAAPSVANARFWDRVPDFGIQGPAGRSLGTFLALVLLVYGVLSLKPVYETIVSPAVAICALFGLVATAFALIVYFVPPQSESVVILALVVLFALMNHDPYKLRFPHMRAYYPGGARGPVRLVERVREIERAFAGVGAPAPETGLIDDEEALESWRARAGAGGDGKPRLVVVAVSGGALRSGLWVAIVLDRLEQQIPGFGRHVRLIAGASGGMLGAAYYLLHRRDSPDLPAWPIPDGSYRPSRWVLDIPRDSLEPVARFIALRSPLLTFLPRVVEDDRGIRLEGDWRALDIPFRDLAGHERAGAIPSMVLSPMVIESGRRLVISNLDLLATIGARGPVLGSDGAGVQPYSLSALEFYRLFPEATDFRLATGVRMNASFPYVSPAVNLPTDPPRRIIDAGLYDNFGVQVAAAWLEKNRPWLAANTSGVVLVQVRDAISFDARFGVVEPSSGLLGRLTRGFRGFTSPPEAVETARTASASFRNDEDVAALAARFEAQVGDPGFFTTVIFENSADVSYRLPGPSAWPGDEDLVSEDAPDVALDWYLTRAEREGLISAIPKPPPGSPWAARANRLRRIEELRERFDRSTGMTRRAVLKQLEQAQNYERLTRLQDWWA